ncbi:DUF1223 domain-containing protein [Blastochloris sulfoviridis]|uniref:DUF1223 domain-containing protein n=1 Tax=Blastochloris sulfoviridis TaxID=50712 RepID=A0A5M6HZ28_9HYPH|nr:DUF1223 domain-containing protein [Blastochloris sulfoviridis]KAA5601172.1 DUF1223 domain-containing protein [Blastochloris sulfoviridis]
MIERLRFLLALIAATTISGPPAAIAAEGPRVVELFTSQGCSSCPPADTFIGQLADRPGVIALSLAVDYWDYLGWKDTLALPAHAARQRAYAETRGDRRLFTPQVVVNGRESVPGQDRAAIERALQAARIHTPVPVSAAVKDGQIKVSVGGSNGVARSGEVWVLGVQRTAAVEISRGENAGHTVAYRNVVRHIRRLAAWTGQPIEVAADLSALTANECDLLVVLVQDAAEGRLGPVFGAGIMPLR